MPYRSHTHDETAARQETGLVADMVRQFADPYTFVRELVQNGIDAGATELKIRAEMRHDGGVALSVTDDGEGMTREIIEGPLLTLFNSAKDEQEGKIGKYGIGFVSVFAVGPAEVIVETWRAEGSWQLTLLPDHSYELATGKARAGSGSVVTLVLPPDGDMTVHAERTHGAVVRWCRHAAIPIHWTHQSHGQPVERERIDRPLAVSSPVTVSSEVGGAHIIVGPSPGSESNDDPELAASFIGFYNHGLTLFESTTPPDDDLVGMRVKILSAELQHTLSRDNVRHDRAYGRAISNAVALSRRPLRSKLRTELEDAALTVAAGGDTGRYEQLLRVATGRAMELSAKEIVVPLTDPIDGETARMANDCHWSKTVVARASSSTVATRTLADRGTPVVMVRSAVMAMALQQVFGGRLTDVDTQVCVVTPRKQDANGRALCRETLRALKAADVSVDTVELGRTASPAIRAAVPCEPGEVALFDRHEWPDWLTRRKTSESILLVAKHEPVARALALAATNARAAGALLARYLLVEARGEVSSETSEALLAAGTGRPE